MKSSRNSGARGLGDSELGQQRLRPERGAKSPSESEWGWGPTSAKKCRLTATSCLVVGCLILAGCRQDMHNQPKYRPLRAAAFFRDGSSARPLVEGTIARGALQEDEAFFTGKVGGTPVTEMPFPVDEHVLDRGEERFNIYCSPCHDRTGSGKGMVVQRGYRQPPSFHDERLRAAPPGHFFDVMTNGFGAMPDYRAQIAPRDRWSVVAYIRALQLAQRASPSDIPGGDPTKLAKPAAPSGQRH
jgi:mono/diheme cytochrome c family protein